MCGIFIPVTRRVIIPVTRRVKGYTRFVGKYVTRKGSVSDPINYIYS